MCQIVRSMFSLMFSRSSVNLKKHLTAPRVPLFDVERQLARQLRAQFRGDRRLA